MKKIHLILLILMFSFIFGGCGNNAKTTCSAGEYVGENFNVVIADLEQAGFENIEIIEIQDLTGTSDLNDGDVGEISIDGNCTFQKETKFTKDANVIITYHTIKKIKIPISSKEIQNYRYDEIVKILQDAGFTNVTSNEIYDLDPDMTDVEFENEVTIGIHNSFEKEQEIPFDANIAVICHKPFERHMVKLHIDFIPNIIFNKYDVKLTVDGEENTLEHGVDGEFEFSLKEDTYTISFISEESDSIKATATIDVNCNMAASYKISCYSDKIAVEELYVDKDEVLADNEVKINCDESEFVFENYVDVINKLKELGFTNITENPMYDIILGWTEEGEVDSVTINGSDSYRRGDVFDKNVEVVVSYHLKQEDDPSNVPEISYEESEITVSSKYEKAFIRELPAYDLYLMFDTDEHIVIYFGTNDSGVMEGIYTGELSEGVEIYWDEVWHENFIYRGTGKYATYVDFNGFEWEYEMCEVSSAQSVLNELE